MVVLVVMLSSANMIGFPNSTVDNELVGVTVAPVVVVLFVAEAVVVGVDIVES